jgi:hypothetical protein
MSTNADALTATQTGAVFSPDRKYRYQLTRSIGPYMQSVNFIMLNPSTADETKDDPSIRRCIGFARSWGFGRLIVTNLFAIRATDPKQMLSEPEPIGQDNSEWLVKSANRSALVVCAWGAHGAHRDRGMEVQRFLLPRHNLHMLRLTAQGEPAHPLYLPGKLEPRLWAEQWTRGEEP